MHPTCCALAGATGLVADFNVAASVNHPLFVGAYVCSILPLLVDVPLHHWKAEYMLPTLAEYLLHHIDMLLADKLWSPIPDTIIRRANL